MLDGGVKKPGHWLQNPVSRGVKPEPDDCRSGAEAATSLGEDNFAEAARRPSCPPPRKTSATVCMETVTSSGCSEIVTTCPTECKRDIKVAALTPSLFCFFSLPPSPSLSFFLFLFSSSPFSFSFSVSPSRDLHVCLYKNTNTHCWSTHG